MINEAQVRGNWQQLKGKVKKQWAKLTDNDLLESEGKSDLIIGQLVERYGITKEEALKEWNKFLEQADSKAYEIKSLANHLYEIVENAADCVVTVAKSYKKVAQDKPVVTLSIAIATSFLLGMLIGR